MNMHKLNIGSPNDRIDFTLLLVIYITALSFFLVPDGGVRYVINITLPAATLLLLLITNIKNKNLHLVLLTLIYGVYISISYLLVHKGINFSAFLSFYSFCFLAYILALSNNSEKLLKLLFNFFSITVISIFLLLLTGVDPNSVFAGSRNTISLLLIPLGCFFLINSNINIKSNKALFIYILIVLNCIIAQGRSGILTSLILLIALILSRIEKINLLKIIFIVVSFLIIYTFYLKYADFIYNLSYFDYIKAKGIEDNYRSSMRNEYFSALSFKNLIFGINLAELPIINSHNGNPHNTYISLHSNFGILILIILVLNICFWLKSLLSGNLVVFLALTALFLRLSTDTTYGFPILPLIFIAFIVSKDWLKKTSIKLYFK